MKYMNTYNIATVVVTYNRKAMLCDCLQAIACQTFKPKAVYIIDNASSDGTREHLVVNGYVSEDSNIVYINDIKFIYVQLAENTGGAGGFYTGMKIANEEGEYDAVWVMDDDGQPHADCLHYLASHLDKYDYISPTVLSIENRKSLSFPYNGHMLEFDDFAVNSINNIVEGYACPMNGILYSKRLLSTVGYPIPNLFIWGDEQNMHLRCINAGFPPITDLRAIHYHPISKDVYETSLGGRKIVFVPQLWKGYCQYRNTIYNYHNTMSFRQLLNYYIIHMYYFVCKIHSLKWIWCFNKAFISGFKKEPDCGYKTYMK